MCNYCHKNINNEKIKDIDNDEESSIEIVRLSFFDHEGYALRAELDGKDEDGYKCLDFFEVKFCPMCGRKLGE